MSTKHSIASKARWAGISSKERSRRMSAIASKRQSKLTKKEKREIALRMVKAKKKKAKLNK